MAGLRLVMGVELKAGNEHSGALSGWEDKRRVLVLRRPLQGEMLRARHAYFDKARQVLTRLSAQLQAWVSEAAEQFGITSVWLLCCDHLKRAIAAIGPPRHIRLLTNHANRI
ncbi:MAG: hypothetical protein LBF91_10725 [Azoarcus sp.]|jgi:hypothetical protein|nr:hypothetical protein [Azoarcus sp.]